LYKHFLRFRIPGQREGKKKITTDRNEKVKEKKQVKGISQPGRSQERKKKLK
jgi:hypothetical protein